MDKNSLTYGFEIEGAFTKKLISKLQVGNFHLQTKNDGSIKYSELVSQYRQKTGIWNTDLLFGNCEEITLGVFKKQTDLLKVMKKINAKNYYWNGSCGLHLHVKPKRNVIWNKHRILDLVFIKDLQKFAYGNLCEHVKDRRGNQYCKPYKNIENMRNRAFGKDKYSFVRFHEHYKTFEFRFFSPCEHKAKNAELFLNYFVKRLNKVDCVSKKRFELVSRNDKEINEKIEIIDKKENNFEIDNKIGGMSIPKLNDYSWEIKMPSRNELSHGFTCLDDCNCTDCEDYFIDNHYCCGECNDCWQCETCKNWIRN